MKPKHTPEFFKSHDKLWYWHVKHRNGNIVAIGGEGYARRAAAKRSLVSFLRSGAELLAMLGFSP